MTNRISLVSMLNEALHNYTQARQVLHSTDHWSVEYGPICQKTIQLEEIYVKISDQLDTFDMRKSK